MILLHEEETHVFLGHACMSILKVGKGHCWVVVYSLLTFNTSSVQFSCSVVSDSLWLHGPQHARLPCPSPTPGACSNSCPLSHDATQPSHPLSSLYPPAFNLSQHQDLFQWASSSHQVAKVLEFQLQHLSFQWMNIQDWFPLELTGLISLHLRYIQKIAQILNI